MRRLSRRLMIDLIFPLVFWLSFLLFAATPSLEAFIYKEGFARLSTHLYEKGNIDNRFIHLTNSRFYSQKGRI